MQRCSRHPRGGGNGAGGSLQSSWILACSPGTRCLGAKARLGTGCKDSDQRRPFPSCRALPLEAVRFFSPSMSVLDVCVGSLEPLSRRLVNPAALCPCDIADTHKTNAPRLLSWWTWPSVLASTAACVLRCHSWSWTSLCHWYSFLRRCNCHNVVETKDLRKNCHFCESGESKCYSLNIGCEKSGGASGVHQEGFWNELPSQELLPFKEGKAVWFLENNLEPEWWSGVVPSKKTSGLHCKRLAKLQIIEMEDFNFCDLNWNNMSTLVTYQFLWLLHWLGLQLIDQSKFSLPVIIFSYRPQEAIL